MSFTGQHRRWCRPWQQLEVKQLTPVFTIFMETCPKCALSESTGASFPAEGNSPQEPRCSASMQLPCPGPPSRWELPAHTLSYRRSQTTLK